MPGDAKKGNIEIRPAIPFESEATYNSTNKDKQKFVDITCRYCSSGADSKKNNYQINVRIFIMVFQRTYHSGIPRFKTFFV